jgi:hypothetical protein
MAGGVQGITPGGQRGGQVARFIADNLIIGARSF